MKIAVIGAGAIGGLLGSLLHASGEEVVLVDVWEEHIKIIQSSGLIVVGPDEEKTVRIKATADITEAGKPELIIVAVKSYDCLTAARDCLKIAGPDTIVLTLQNGVGNVEILGETLGRSRIIAGTCAFGSTVLGPGKIRPTPAGSLSIGELDGSITDRLRDIAAMFTRAGVEIHLSREVDSLIWTKLMVNVGINALAAITFLTNGELLEFEETRSLQAAAVNEGIAVAKAKGIPFMVDDVLEYVRNIARATYHNIASMRQDVERGARTEILAINGAIVAEGEKLGIPTPVNDTLTKLVQTLEKRREKSPR